MIKNLLKTVARRSGRILGVEEVSFQLQQQKELFRRQNNLLRAENHQLLQKLDQIASQLEFTTIDTDRLRNSNRFKNCHELIPLLTPMDVSGSKYIRLGRDYDGGYVMLDDFSSSEIDAAYSFGISNDVSWDEEIAERGIDVYMYDHTIGKLPKEHSRFHFFKQGLTGNPPEKDLETLSNLIAQNGHQNFQNLIMKMDVEGYEWGVFEETPSSVISQFSQIAIEFHGLDPNKSPDELASVTAVLKKLHETHQPVHVHANGYTAVSWLGDSAIPNLLEVTYIRRADYADRLIPNTRTFPTKLDQPTFPWLSDVNLGTFSISDPKAKPDAAV